MKEKLEKRVDRLEEVLIELVLAQRRAEEAREKFWQGMKELKEAQRRAEKEHEKFWQAMEELKEVQKKTKEAQRRTEESLRRLSRKLEGLSDRLGTLAEDILAPGIPYLLEGLGFWVKSMWLNEEVRLADGRSGEFDAVVVAEKDGREVLFLCEVKSKLEERHFEQLKKQYKLYREVGMRRDLPIKPVLAALRIPKHLVNHANKRGVLLVKMGGDYLEALSPEILN